ncbi:MAG: diguanylate cyclase [Nitrospinae bacterium]|nr:diguanylate cyclase [Nitrospinota bacterium]
MNEFKESSNIVKKAIPFLSKNKIPLTPENYKVAYEYYSGNIPDLKNSVDGLLDSGGLTETGIKEIYIKFFSRDFDREYNNKLTEHVNVVNETADRIEGMIVSTIKEIFMSIGKAGKYNDSLNECFNNLIIADNIDKLKNTISSLLKHTSDIVTSYSETEREFKETVKELEKVKEELRKSEKDVRTDMLTKVHNRYAFNEKMIEELERFSRYKSPCSLSIIDIDDFKVINDKYGHPVGDKVLIDVAKIITDSLRKIDHVSSIGGEEFALILPNTNLDNAVIVIKRIVEAIDSTDYTVSGKSIKITISAGVTEFINKDIIKTVIERADKSLYDAKNNGKNRVMFDQIEEPNI